MEERGWVLRLHLFWASPLARDSHLPQKNYTCFAGYLNYNKKIGVTRISNYYKYTCGDLFIKFTATNRKMAWLSFANFVTIHINPLAW